MNDSDEIATLYACYRSGALSRRELLEGIAGITGAAAAAAMLTTLETHGPEVEPNLALAACIAEMSDRLEIQGNVWDFSNAIDLQAWDMLDHVFTLDAEMAYGGVFLKGPRIKDWLRDTLTRPDLYGYCHMMLEPHIELSGDTAKSLTRCLNPMEIVFPDERRQVRYHFGWYHFQHVRTAQGWRIRRRLSDPDEVREVHWQTPSFNAVRANPPLPYREA
jgi:hypothetical protein